MNSWKGFLVVSVNIYAVKNILKEEALGQVNCMCTETEAVRACGG